MNSFLFYLKKNVLISLLIIIASLIFFTNLSGQDYSLDEPETVTLAKSIFVHGFPSPWDGLNLVSTNNGRDIIFLNGNYFWQWQPWLQHYLIFLGINIFGDNLFGQRFFFALLGVGTVVLTYFTGKELFKNKYVTFLICLQLIFLLPFFLYTRSARYYSPSIFFSLFVFYLFILGLKNKWKEKQTWSFLFINILLFFSNYIVWLTTSLFAFFLAYAKKNKKILYVLFAQFILAIIWFLIFKPYSGNTLVFNQFKNIPINMIKNFSYINTFVFPLILLPMAFLIRKNKILLLLFCLVFLKVFVYSIFLIPHGRYLSDLFPLFVLISGYIYDYLLIRKKTLIALLLFLIITFTNLLNLPPNVVLAKQKMIFHFWPQEYYVELTGKYQTVMPQLGNYLKSRYKKGDLFLSNNYNWYVYYYSKVPAVSPVCDAKKNQFIGPETITKKSNVRWVIIFPLNNNYQFPCMSFKNLQDLESKYKMVELKFNKDTRVVNDVDIFNRQFPPIKIREGEVYLFEKKE